MADKNDVRFTIGAPPDNLRRDLDEANRLIGQFAANGASKLGAVDKGFDALSSKVLGLNRLLPALSVGAIAVGLVSLARSALESADAIAKMAERTGLTTAEVQEFGHAAALAGVSAEELDTALGFLNRKIAEGNTPFRTASEGMRSIAERIAQTSDGAERARIAFENFGRGGIRLIPMLAQGAAGLREAAEEAHRLGIVLDDDTVRGAERAKDQLEILSTVISRNLHQAILHFAPVLEKFSADLAESFKEVRIVHDMLFRSFDEEGELATVKRLQILGRELDAARNRMAQLREEADMKRSPGARLEMEQLEAQAERVERRIAVLQSHLDALRGPPKTTAPITVDDRMSDAAERVRRSLENQLEALTKSEREQFIWNHLVLAGAEAGTKEAAAIQALAAYVYDYKAALDGAVRNAKELNDAEAAQQAAREALAMATIEHANAIKAVTQENEREILANKILIEALRESNAGYVRRKEILDETEKLRKAGATEEEIAAERQRIELLGEQRAKIEEIRDANEAARRAARDFANVIGQAFEDAVLRGDELRDVLHGLLQDIERIIMRVLVTKPLENALTGVIGGGGGLLGFLGGLLGGGGVSIGTGLTAAQSAAMPMIFAKGGVLERGRVQRFAQGAVLSHPTVFPMADGVGLAGEEGPEAVLPLRRGRGGRLGVELSGGGNIINNNFAVDLRGASMEAVQELRTLVMEVNGSIEQRAISAVSGERARRPTLLRK
jgi:hypothetical protein